jgi:hypothetical protein
MSYFEKAKLVPFDIGSDSSMLISEIHCRYSFLLIANSIEAAANSLISDVTSDESLYSDLEKLSTLTKFRIFCEFKGVTLDKGNVKYSRVKEIIECRNEFVHPKPRSVNYSVHEETGDISFNVKKTHGRGYPHYFSLIRPEMVLVALQDTLSFLSWICFDLCKYELKAGAMLIGNGAYGSTADIDILGSEYGISFDMRTFGK